MKSTLCLSFCLFMLRIIPLEAKGLNPPPRAPVASTPVEAYIVEHPISVSQEREVSVPGFLLATEVEPLCILIQGAEEESIIVDGIHFQCTRKKAMQVGHTYSVIRQDSDFEDKINSNHRLYWMVSQVRILSNEELSTGKVEKEIIPIEPGDWVVEPRSVTRKFQLRSQTSHLGSRRAFVLAFSFAGQSYGIEEGFVFLGQGRKSGLDVDAVLPIYSPPGSKDDSIPKNSIGTVQIIEASDTSSVGYLVKTVKEIPLGAAVLF
jgi:hypothetical protein